MNKFCLPFFCALFFTSTLQAQLSFNLRTSGLGAAVDIVNDPSDSSRLFVVTQSGQIKIVDGNYQILANDFIDIKDSLIYQGERGLLSMAFHPDYANNGYFFVLYTSKGSGALTLERYQRATNNTAIPTSGVKIKSIPHPGHSNHNGGKIAFGNDGYLYWSTGDGGGGGDPDRNAQSGKSLLGKMLRYDVNNFNTAPYYTIPASNPFINDTAFLDDIWALGLRNPFRWSFDRLNGDMWIADVGQNAWEEVNVTPGSSTGGENYGWRCKEGTHVYAGNCTTSTTPITDPVFEYDHSFATGGLSITGGYVYRGSNAGLYGKYICADYISGNVWLLTASGGNYTSQLFSNLPGSSNITGFGEKANGDLFAVSHGGDLYQIGYTAASVNGLDKDNHIHTYFQNHDLIIKTTTDLNGFQLYNLQGQLVYHHEVVGLRRTATYNLPEILPGMYILKVITAEKEVFTKRLAKWR